ncbi:MAG: cysteine--tRNA ligase [Sedimentisphaerales bacterium]|nr:cysteine--tRNA ligase [Sedimentisphaerales bacterium]
MALRIYNTLTKEKELFEPIRPGKVGIYVCGPTVYKESHIGHAVGPVIFDALKKYLTYKGYQVTLVINITDVDDKIIAEAQRLGVPTEQLASQISDSYFEAMEKLGVTSVDHYPRATEHIADIIHLIQRLGERQAAYAAGSDVYFDVAKCPQYGRLSNRRPSEQLEASRQLSGQGKHNPGDFALWKAAKDDEPVAWDSPWGRGRPGWHIECSVMSMKYLGESFDIHGGGLDLVFPHHENEIAQSETATGRPFAKYWMHNGLTRIQTKAAGGEWKAEKMSKSLGNIRPLGALLAAYPPELIRFFLLSTHYRRPIDFSDEALEATQKGLAGIHRLFERIERLGGQDVFQTACSIERWKDRAQTEADQQFIEAVTQAKLRYLEALDDDFNTAAAIAVLHELCTRINRYIDQQRQEIQANRQAGTLMLEGGRMVTGLAQTLGLLTGPPARADAADGLTDALMQLLIELRAEARRRKDFALSDAIRDRLKAIGVALEDHPDQGTTWRKD